MEDLMDMILENQKNMIFISFENLCYPGEDSQFGLLTFRKLSPAGTTTKNGAARDWGHPARISGDKF